MTYKDTATINRILVLVVKNTGLIVFAIIFLIAITIIQSLQLEHINKSINNLKIEVPVEIYDLNDIMSSDVTEPVAYLSNKCHKCEDNIKDLHYIDL